MFFINLGLFGSLCLCMFLFDYNEVFCSRIYFIEDSGFCSRRNSDYCLYYSCGIFGVGWDRCLMVFCIRSINIFIYKSLCFFVGFNGNG